jgi:hypothetical protein
MSENKMLLVKFSANWADEFDVDGFAIMTQEQYDKNLAFYSRKDAYFGFGTNQDLEGSDIVRGFSAQEVGDDEVHVLRNLFPELNSSYYPVYGMFPYAEEDDINED